MTIRLYSLSFVLTLVALQGYALEPPRECPPLGLCLPAQFVRARDADTIEWRVPGSAFVFASRLIDCWAPEKDGGNQFTRAIARQGTEFTTAACAGRELRVYIPLPKGPQPLKSLTFDRIPSYVFVDDDTTLNVLLIENKFASTTKGGELGK